MSTHQRYDISSRDGIEFATAVHTLEFLSKKYLNFGKGLDFLKFSERNRSENDENQREIEENN